LLKVYGKIETRRIYMSNPKSFEDLTPAELYRSAVEDFALVVEPTDKSKKKVLLAAFVEGGIGWDDYVAQHPEVAPEPVEVLSVDPTVTEPVGLPVTDTTKVIVATAPKIEEDATYLVKMERDNPLYETRGYRFTQKNPYALVGAKDVDYILTNEDGFRQATPAELREYYG
jgi:hypothetical protein